MDLNATLIGQMITFALFVWFTMKFVWPVLEKKLVARQQKIAEGLAAAERGHTELEVAQKYAIQHIHEARTKAVDLVEQAKKQAGLIMEEAKSEALQEREKIVVSGRAQVAQEQRKAQEKLQQEVADLVVKSVEKLLGRMVTETDQQRLFDIQADALLKTPKEP